MPEDKLPSSVDLLEQVCKIMEDRDLTEVYLREGELTLRVRRGGISLPVSSSLSGSLASVPATEQVNPSAPILAGQLQHEGVETICSPMPGMYYHSPAPEDPSYVEVGSIVSEEDIVGLIEAMKIFNEVKPGFACEILEILVENATAVEFDQPLFRVKKN